MTNIKGFYSDPRSTKTTKTRSMPAGDKRDFLVPGGGLGSRLLSRAVGAVQSTEPVADSRALGGEGS